MAFIFCVLARRPKMGSGLMPTATMTRCTKTKKENTKHTMVPLFHHSQRLHSRGLVPNTNASTINNTGIPIVVVTICFMVTILLSLPQLALTQLDEVQRRKEYSRRGYLWPPRDDEYSPPTTGWRALFQRRFRQIDALQRTENKYEGYMNAIHTGLQCPNFTEYGWGLTSVPEVSLCGFACLYTCVCVCVCMYIGGLANHVCST